MIGWKTQLDRLMNLVRLQPDVSEIPPAAATWFDINFDVYHRGKNRNDAATDLLAVKSTLTQWQLKRESTVIYGWEVELARYTRNGVPLWIVWMSRDGAEAKDWKLRDHMVEYLGADPEHDFLMMLGPEQCPDLVSLWTWRDRVN